MNASTLFPSSRDLINRLGRLGPMASPVAPDQDEADIADCQDEGGLVIDPDDLALNEARQAYVVAEQRLAEHGDGEPEAVVWEKRPYLLTSSLGALLVGLGFTTSPFAASAPLAAAATAAALSLAADRLGRDLRLTWHAGWNAGRDGWLGLVTSAVIALGLGIGGSLMLAGHAPIWALLLIVTLSTLALAGWRRQDPDPERKRLEEAAERAKATVDDLRTARQQELQSAKTKLDHLLADLAEA